MLINIAVVAVIIIKVSTGCGIKMEAQVIPQRGKNNYTIRARVTTIMFLLAEDQPNIRYINRHVRSHICEACDSSPGMWKDLGIELMGQDSVADINAISVNNYGDIVGCCSSMFSLWLQKQPEASWKQLIDALINIKLNQLAAEIKKLLIPSEKQESSPQRLVKGTFC